MQHSAGLLLFLNAFIYMYWHIYIYKAIRLPCTKKKRAWKIYIHIETYIKKYTYVWKVFLLFLFSLCPLELFSNTMFFFFWEGDAFRSVYRSDISEVVQQKESKESVAEISITLSNFFYTMVLTYTIEGHWINNLSGNQSPLNTKSQFMYLFHYQVCVHESIKMGFRDQNKFYGLSRAETKEV